MKKRVFPEKTPPELDKIADIILSYKPKKKIPKKKVKKIKKPEGT